MLMRRFNVITNLRRDDHRPASPNVLFGSCRQCFKTLLLQVQLQSWQPPADREKQTTFPSQRPHPSNLRDPVLDIPVVGRRREEIAARRRCPRTIASRFPCLDPLRPCVVEESDRWLTSKCADGLRSAKR